MAKEREKGSGRTVTVGNGIQLEAKGWRSEQELGKELCCYRLSEGKSNGGAVGESNFRVGDPVTVFIR